LGKIGSFPTDAIEVAEVSQERSPLNKDVFLARFSNQGREIDVCAPGVGVVSTWVGGGFAVENGTSMACPIVTGIGAALLAQERALLSMDRGVTRSLGIVQLIQGACETIGLPQIYEGSGQPKIG